MNDGTIGNNSSNATARAYFDTWQLFNLLWNLAEPYDTGIPFNQICQMYASNGSPVNYGSSAIADFNANRQLALTSSMGRVMMGTVPIDALLLRHGRKQLLLPIHHHLFFYLHAKMVLIYFKDSRLSLQVQERCQAIFLLILFIM